MATGGQCTLEVIYSIPSNFHQGASKCHIHVSLATIVWYLASDNTHIFCHCSKRNGTFKKHLGSLKQLMNIFGRLNLTVDQTPGKILDDPTTTNEGSFVATATICKGKISPCNVALSSWETLEPSFQVFVANIKFLTPTIDVSSQFSLSQPWMQR